MHRRGVHEWDYWALCGTASAFIFVFVFLFFPALFFVSPLSSLGSRDSWSYPLFGFFATEKYLGYNFSSVSGMIMSSKWHSYLPFSLLHLFASLVFWCGRPSACAGD